jgi:murE/murF fusion protein
MQLSRLIDAIEPLSVVGVGRTDEVPISSIEIDAERVHAGTLFVALPFWLGDRHNSVSRAIKRGATAVVAEHAPLLADAPTGVLVPDSRAALGQLLSAWHRYPSRSMTILAVTGTHGKTTVTHLLRHILASAGRSTDWIGTLGASIGGRARDTGYTTPPAEILQPLLAEAHTAGVTHVCLEASSEALALRRLAGTRVAVAGFTNLARDHLDFHADPASYREAKAILFRELAERACFNVDDEVGEQFHRTFPGVRLSVSTIQGSAADLVLECRQASLSGTFVRVRHGSDVEKFMLPMPGSHNVENAAVALGMSLLVGVSLTEGIEALESATLPRGRLERIGERPRVFVDFAHTPGALRRVLAELKTLVAGRLICVFGAGGNRDPGKRPLMAQAVSELADAAILTSDNPRWENPSAIIAEVSAGASSSAQMSIEVDRVQALRRAIQDANDEDTLLIAGKGHETWQEIRGCRLPLDDAEICREQLALRHRRTPDKGLSVHAVEAALDMSGTGGSNASIFTQAVVDAAAPGSLFVLLARPEGACDVSAAARAISRAIAEGATGVICDAALSGTVPADVRAFPVRDPVAAYRTIAGLWRHQFDLPIVAVAGAAGKTTTKDLIAGALGRRFNVLATPENLNGFLGVPHTLLRLRTEHDTAVVEIGIDTPGVMALQVAIVSADIAVLTSLGLEHLDGFGNLETAVAEQVALFRHVAHAGGTLLVNLDDPLVVAACEALDGGRRIGFTLEEGPSPHAKRAAVHQVVRGRRHGERLWVEGLGMSAFDVRPPLPGTHNARNVLAAVAIARVLGCSADDIVGGMEASHMSPGRAQCVNLGGIEVICDFYNANPVSMQAALQLLDERRRAMGGSAWACLGELAEMADLREQVHRGVAREAHRLGLENVITIGAAGRYIGDELHRLGSAVTVRHVDDCAEMAEAILRGAAPSDVVLLKGSRSNRLELAWEHLAQALWIRDMQGQRHRHGT